MGSDKTWLIYVAIAGLAWGTYVPLVFFGGSELKSPPGNVGGRLTSILCVGIAYFVLAVAIPILLISFGDSKTYSWPTITTNGLVFSSLAGVAGAVGAICVIFGSKAAIDAGRAINPADPNMFRIYLAPLIFALAPLINTLVSLVWHPDAKTGEWFHFGFEMPSWKLVVGIVLVGAGSFLVLLSKEEAEAAKSKPIPKQEAPIEPKSES
jgi:hypothetical protein